MRMKLIDKTRPTKLNYVRSIRSIMFHCWNSSFSLSKVVQGVWSTTKFVTYISEFLEFSFVLPWRFYKNIEQLLKNDVCVILSMVQNCHWVPYMYIGRGQKYVWVIIRPQIILQMPYLSYGKRLRPRRVSFRPHSDSDHQPRLEFFIMPVYKYIAVWWNVIKYECLSAI